MTHHTEQPDLMLAATQGDVALVRHILDTYTGIDESTLHWSLLMAGSNGWTEIVSLLTPLYREFDADFDPSEMFNSDSGSE